MIFFWISETWGIIEAAMTLCFEKTDQMHRSKLTRNSTSLIFILCIMWWWNLVKLFTNKYCMLMRYTLQ